ncbi:ABC transporter substrate-binding protein [Candidatus Atribacteria bacterium HGW-Atribacteria-1]|nr:MAG: ABC transporter substrate-binding protein [Candidatus Atribacteria bacterium HGW-Atribacteria-1]
MKVKRLFVMGLVVMFLLVSFTQSLFAQQKEKILLYTSVPTNIMSAIEEEFEKENPDVDLEFVRAGTGQIKTRIITECEAGRIEADLIWVAEFSYYEDLKELTVGETKGLLLRYESPKAKGIPTSLKDSEGYYYGARMINEVIAYNTNLVSDPPRTWEDLLDPKWKDQVALADVSYSGAALVAMGALTEKYGIEYYQKLRENGTAVLQAHGGLTQSIAAGEYKVGMSLDYMIRQQKEAGSPINLIYPEDGAIAIPSPIAIVATTEHPDAAKKFVDYILSVNGQLAQVKLGSTIPVRPEIVPPLGAPSLNQLLEKSIPVDYEYIRSNAGYLTSQFTEILLAP